MWKVKKIISKGDYNYALVPEHPKATKQGYVLHHRIVAEMMLGRLLKVSEVVHHKDRNKKNNDPSNLEVLSIFAHAMEHAVIGRNWTTLVCPNCGRQFEKETRLIKPNTTPKCSRSCNGAYSRKLQLQTDPIVYDKDRLFAQLATLKL